MAVPFVIGSNQDRDEVCLDYGNRRLSTYVVGRQGMGKSKLLLRMGLHDIEQGHGLSVITPDGDLIRDFLACIPEAHKDRVILFDPTDTSFPCGLNIFSCSDPTDDLLVGKIAGDVVTKTFELLWKDSWGYQMEQVMRMVSTTITLCQGMPVSERPTLTEFSTMLVNMPFREKYIAYVRANFPGYWKILEWWDHFDGLKSQEREDLIRSTLNKADKFAEQPPLANIFGQAESSIHLRQIMDTQQILLVDLSKGAIGQENSRLIGAILVGQLYLAAISRANILESDRNPFHLIVDEFQNFATDAFFELHEEARKYAIDTVIAHQNLSQLLPGMQDRALGAGSKIVLQVTGQDADRLAGEFDATPPPTEVSHRQPEYAISANPWTELKRGGGQSNEIAQLVERITQKFEKSEYVRRTTFYIDDDPIARRHQEEEFDKEVERLLNKYLRSRMLDEEIWAVEIFVGLLKAEYRPHDLLCIPCGQGEGEGFWVLGRDYYPGGIQGGYIVPQVVRAKLAVFEVLRSSEIEEIKNGVYHNWLRFDRDARYAEFVRWVKSLPPQRETWEQETKQEAHLRAWVDSGVEGALALEQKSFNSWYKFNMQQTKLLHDFTQPIRDLGDILSEKPIVSPSIYHEPVLEKPRTYDDVRNENANALKKLERFHAWAAFPDGTEQRNIALLEAEDCGDDEEIAQYIRDQSREKYGRDRRYVEAMIAARRQPRPAKQEELDDVPPSR